MRQLKNVKYYAIDDFFINDLPILQLKNVAEDNDVFPKLLLYTNLCWKLENGFIPLLNVRSSILFKHDAMPIRKLYTSHLILM